MGEGKIERETGVEDRKVERDRGWRESHRDKVKDIKRDRGGREREKIKTETERETGVAKRATETDRKRDRGA